MPDYNAADEMDMLVRTLTTTDLANQNVVEVERALVNLLNVNNPLRQNIERRPGEGTGYRVRRRTPGTTYALTVSETDSLSEGKGTFSNADFTWKTVGIQVKLTRLSQKTMANLTDQLADELEAKMNEFRDYEEHLLFYGDSSTTSTEPDGLNTQLASAASSQTVTATTTSGAFTLNDLDEAIDACKGQPNLILASKRGARKLNGLLQGVQRFVNWTEVKGGFRVPTYDGIPVLRSTRILDTLGNDGSYSTTGSFTNIYVVNTQEFFVKELTPLTVDPLAKTSSQWQALDIYEDFLVVLRDTQACSRLVGCYAPSG